MGEKNRYWYCLNEKVCMHFLNCILRLSLTSNYNLIGSKSVLLTFFDSERRPPGLRFERITVSLKTIRAQGRDTNQGRLCTWEAAPLVLYSGPLHLHQLLEEGVVRQAVLVTCRHCEISKTCQHCNYWRIARQFLGPTPLKIRKMNKKIFQ